MLFTQINKYVNTVRKVYFIIVVKTLFSILRSVVLPEPQAH